MCGRYYIENDIEDIVSSYGIANVNNIKFSKGEIFPGTNIPIIFNNEGRKLVFFRWGYKIESLNKEVINARIESVAEKRNFRKAFFNNRCIIPANAFLNGKVKKRAKLNIRFPLMILNFFQWQEYIIILLIKITSLILELSS